MVLPAAFLVGSVASCAESDGDYGFLDEEARAREDLAEEASSAYAVIAQVDRTAGCTIESQTSSVRPWVRTSVILANDLEPLRATDEVFLAEAVASDELFVFGVKTHLERVGGSDRVLFLVRPYTEQLETGCDRMGFHSVAFYRELDQSGVLTFEEMVDVIRETEVVEVEPVNPSNEFSAPLSNGP